MTDLPQGYEPHEIPPDYTGPLFLESQMRAVIEAEREAISDEYAARLQGDLENGVRWLNEAAASEFHKKYPQLASFNEWLNEREKDD